MLSANGAGYGMKAVAQAQRRMAQALSGRSPNETPERATPARRLQRAHAGRSVSKPLEHALRLTLTRTIPLIVSVAIPFALLALPSTALCSDGSAANSAPASSASPPEERRFERTKFLIGLRRLGLWALQSDYMHAFPPRDDAERYWYEREKLLSRAMSTSASLNEKLDAIRQADAFAARAIASEPNSVRSILWRLDRAQSLLYDAAGSLLERVFFLALGEPESSLLSQFASRAEQAIDDAIDSLKRYLDLLSQPDGARLALEADKLNLNAFRMMRDLQFDRAWAWFCQAIAMPSGSVQQGLILGKLTRFVEEGEGLPLGPADPCRARATFMKAVADRLLGDWPACSAGLSETVRILKKLPATQQKELEWLEFAVEVERIRLLLEQADFDAAIRKARQLFSRDWAGLAQVVRFSRQLTAAVLLYESATRAAIDAGGLGDETRRREYLSTRFEALARVAVNWPEYRQQVLQITARKLPPEVKPHNLAPFGKLAFACMLVNGGKCPAAVPLLDSVRKRTQVGIDDIAKMLHCEALYLEARCLRRLGKRMEAAGLLFEFARRYPTDARAKNALATCLTLMLRADAIRSPEIRGRFIKAAEMMVRRWPQTSQRWLIPLGEALLAEGRYQRAAEIFASVPADSPFRPYAVWGKIMASAGQIERQYRSAPPASEDLPRRAEQTVSEAKNFARHVLTRKQKDPRQARLAAEALVAASRLCALVLGQPARAVELLEPLTGLTELPPDVAAKVLLTKIHAYQQMKRFDAAGRLVAQFATQHPAKAGPVLQALLERLQASISDARRVPAGSDEAEQAKLALTLAEQLNAWADRNRQSISDSQRYQIRLKLARACLDAGMLEKALKLYDALVAEDAARWPDGRPRDAQVLKGQAETLFRLGRYAEARDAFVKIWQRAEPRSELWWRSLLRALQCSARLGEDRSRILKSIRMHRKLWPDMGGPELRAQFEALYNQLAAPHPKASQPSRKNATIQH